MAPIPPGQQLLGIVLLFGPKCPPAQGHASGHPKYDPTATGFHTHTHTHTTKGVFVSFEMCFIQHLS